MQTHAFDQRTPGSSARQLDSSSMWGTVRAGNVRPGVWASMHKAKIECKATPGAEQSSRKRKKANSVPGQRTNMFGKVVSGSQGVELGRKRDSSELGDVPSNPKEKVPRVRGVQSGQAWESIVGLADETTKQHLKRHPKFNPSCGRCVYNARRDSMEHGDGSHKHYDRGNLLRTVWLGQRPLRMGGAWGLGCKFCAAFRDRCEDERDAARREGRTLPKRRTGPADARTKWGRFEVRNPEQIAVRGLRQHALTDQHRRAIRAHFAPDALQTYRTTTTEDEQLFKGGVPQVADWLRAWRLCKTPQSFLAGEASGQTETFIYRSRVQGASRKALKTQVRMMAKVFRRRKAEQLSKARKICLMLDDRGEYRVVSFRCDAERPEGVEKTSWSGAVSGCLGVLRRGGNFEQKQLQDGDEDYSREMAASIIRCIERVLKCPDTNLTSAQRVKDICSKVVIGVADGGPSVQKCLRFLAVGEMKNMLWVGRDRAHAVRIATSGPLLAEDRFRAWWHDAFEDKYALLPSIKNSDEWTAKLVLCQKEVLRMSGSQGGQCTAVQRVIALAKQRFDSLASPQRQFCVMLVAFAMLLAYVSSDWRVARATRDRATRRLEELPDMVVTIGLSATYSEEAIRFIRSFDVGNHDPALTYTQRREFLRHMRALFVEGRIFTDVSADGNDAGTLLHIAMDQARAALPIYYDGGKVLRLHRKPHPEAAREIHNSITAVTESMEARVEAELSMNDMGVKFTCFDLRRWHEALQDTKNKADRSKLDLLYKQTRDMFTCWAMNGSQGVRELSNLACRLCEVEASHLNAGAPRDNRIAWAQVLEPGFLDENDACTTLLPMLKTYLVASDSTCGVERDLGSLTRVLAAHAGPTENGGETIADLVEVLLDGPSDETELAESPKVEAEASQGVVHQGVIHESLLQPTDLCREFARMWVDSQGRRFNRYARGQKSGPKPKPKLGTMAEVARNTEKTMRKLKSSEQPVDRDARTVLGLTLKEFARAPGTANPAKSSAKLKDFDDLTKRKVIAGETLQRARVGVGASGSSASGSSGPNPYGIDSLNPKSKLRLGKVLHGPLMPNERLRKVGVRASGSVGVMDFCKFPLPPRAGYTVARPLDAVADLLRQVQNANMVVMDTPWFVDGQGTPTRLGLAMNFAAVALGKPVLARAHWCLCREQPHGPPNQHVVFFQSAMRMLPRRLVLSPSFRLSNAWLCRFIEAVVQADAKSQWEVKPDGGQGAAATTLATLADVRRFILGVRRVWYAGGARMGGGYFPRQPQQ